jgi:hypothetical protein
LTGRLLISEAGCRFQKGGQADLCRPAATSAGHRDEKALANPDGRAGIYPNILSEKKSVTSSLVMRMQPADTL